MPSLSGASVLLSLFTSNAAAKELTSGELYDTAHTLEKGEFALHPLFQKSSYGILDTLDVKFRLLGLLAGPGASVEYAYPLSETMSISVEPQGAMGWNQDTFKYGIEGHFSTALGENRLNVGGGAFKQRLFTIEGVAFVYTPIPIRAGFDLVPSEKTVVQMSLATDLYLLDHGTTNWHARAHWNQGSEKFRFGLGLDLIYGEFPDVPEDLAELIPEGIVLPIPYLALWWKL
jgi:hypothetical protein